MPAPEHILTKVKLLLNLCNSPNANESANARNMADKLIAKYSISEEELESLKDKKPLYGEDERLFQTFKIEGWKSQLALGVGNKFDCQIVQEESIPSEGAHEYNYYVYGDPEDVEKVKIVFNILLKKIESLVVENCFGRGNIYISSYCEGLIQAVRLNLLEENIYVQTKKSRTINSQLEKKVNSEAIVENKVKKDKPVENSTDVNSQSLIKDIGAYFRGLDHGRYLSIQEILELEEDNENFDQLAP